MAVPTGAESVTVTVDAAVQGVCARVRSRVHSLRVELQRTLMHHAALCEVDAEVLARQRCSGWDVQSHWLYRSAQRRHWWLMRVFPLSAVACLAIAFLVFYSVQFAESRNSLVWISQAEKLSTVTFPSVVLCSNTPLTEVTCFLSMVPFDCSITQFTWKKSDSYISESLECSILFSDPHKQPTVHLLDTDLSSSSTVDISVRTATFASMTLLSLSSSFSADILQQKTQVPLSTAELTSLLTNHLFSVQNFFPTTSSANFIPLVLQKYSFLDSSKDYSAFLGDQFQKGADSSGRTFVSLTLGLRYAYHYIETYSFPVSEYVVRLLVSTGALFSAYRFTLSIGASIHKRWRMKVNIREKLYSQSRGVFSAADEEVEERGHHFGEKDDVQEGVPFLDMKNNPDSDLLQDHSGDTMGTTTTTNTTRATDEGRQSSASGQL